jgi:hypothetical protein
VSRTRVRLADLMAGRHDCVFLVLDLIDGHQVRASRARSEWLGSCRFDADAAHREACSEIADGVLHGGELNSPPTSGWRGTCCTVTGPEVRGPARPPETTRRAFPAYWQPAGVQLCPGCSVPPRAAQPMEPKFSTGPS